MPTKKIAETTKEVSDWAVDVWDAYKNDGCTGIPDLYLESPCDRHDRHYALHKHRDGTPITRLEADWELAKDSWKALPVVPKDTLTKWNFIPMLPVMFGRMIAKNVLPVVIFSVVRVTGSSHWEEP